MLTDALSSVALVVDPVPWARSQMAFTLAFHIILVPLGVSWSVMTLIANYRGIKRNDPDAMLLAQRWSKYMAVTFAVGAVTGTVLSFEFGLLWPKFMGQWGRGLRGAVRLRGDLLLHRGGLHLDLHLRVAPAEAVGPLLDRRADRGRGHLRQHLVVAANAWMNSPQGVTLDSSGKVTDVDPMG
jgi:cytochrome d ubiquinol oxidase subunit I